MEKFGKRFTFVDVFRGETQRVLIAADRDAEYVLVVAKPDGPDGVFVIRCDACATKSDEEMMMRALDDLKVPYIQNQF